MRAKTVHELRREVTALHKDRVSRLPVDEAVKFISEHYDCDEDSARAYVSYLRGETGSSLFGEEEEESAAGLNLPGAKKPATEVIHTRFDPLVGRWVRADEEPSK